MATNETSATVTPRRHNFFTSSLGLRVLMALVISILIVMAFFATSALSH